MHEKLIKLQLRKVKLLQAVEDTKKKKEKILLMVQGLLKELNTGRITKEEYDDKLNSALKKRSAEKWLKYYDDYLKYYEYQIKICDKQIKENRKETKVSLINQPSLRKEKITIYGGWEDKPRKRRLAPLLLILIGAVLIAIVVSFFINIQPAEINMFGNIGEKVSGIFSAGETSGISETIESTLNVNLEESNILIEQESLVQYQAVVGQPVKWKKQFKTDLVSGFSVELPKGSENISIKRSGEDITRLVSISKKRTFFIFWEKSIEVSVNTNSITGMAIGDSENQEQEIEITYETPAPEISEEITEEGKRIMITGPSDVHYKNILSFIELPKELSKEEIGNLNLYEILNGERQETKFIVYDSNENNLFDYIEWITPQLSQAEFIIITNVTADTMLSGITAESGFTHLQVSDPSLVLYLPFDENSSTTKVYDYTSRNNDGTIYGNYYSYVYNEGLAYATGEFSYLGYTIDGDFETYGGVGDFSGGIVYNNWTWREKFNSGVSLYTTAEGDGYSTIDYSCWNYTSNNWKLFYSNWGSFSLNTPLWGTLPIPLDCISSGKHIALRTDINIDGDGYTDFYENALIIKSSISHYITGKYGSGMSFNGVDDYISAPTNGIPSGNASRTISLWFKPNNFGTDGYPMISFGGAAGVGAILTLAAEDNAVSVGFGGHRLISPKSSLSTGTWYHVALTIPENASTTNNFTLYINGIAVSTTVEVGSVQGLNTISPIFTLGRYNWSAINFYNGSLDEVMIFNRSLIAAEIAQIYNSTFPRFVSSGTQVFNNQSKLKISTGSQKVTITGDYQALQSSSINLSVGYYDGSWQYTSPQIFTGNNIFTISPSSTNLSLNFTFNAGTTSNPFYSPLLSSNIKTLNINVSQDNIAPSINFEDPTPANKSTLNNNFIPINVSASDDPCAFDCKICFINNDCETGEYCSAGGCMPLGYTSANNISVFIDFNNSLVGWWRMDDVGTWVFDDDEDSATEDAPYVNIEYIKPVGASPLSLWEVKQGTQRYNVTIPQECWNYNPSRLYFRVSDFIIDTIDMAGSYGECRFGPGVNDWKIITLEKEVSGYATNGSEVPYTRLVDENWVSGAFYLNSKWVECTGGGCLNWQFYEEAMNWFILDPLGDSIADYSAYGNHGTIGKVCRGTLIGGCGSLTSSILCKYTSGRCIWNGASCVNAAPGLSSCSQLSYVVCNFVSGCFQQNSSAYQVEGKMGKGFEFNGVDDYLNLGNASILDLDYGSWGAWVKLKGNATRGRILFKEMSDPIAGHRGLFELFYWEDTNRFRGEVVINGIRYTVTSIGAVKLNKWYYLFVTYDGDFLRLYLDGVLITETDVPEGLVDKHSLPLSIGSSVNEPTFAPFNGTIDDVMVFKRALSNEEIKGLYANTSSKYLFKSFSSLNPGNYTFKAYAQDSAGNVNQTETRSVEINEFVLDSCNVLDKPNTYYNLTTNLDLGWGLGVIYSCITITAPNITLDCQGYYINIDKNYPGVYSNQKYTTIKNCNITMNQSEGTGIKLDGANNSYVFNCTLNNQGYGIAISSGSNINLKNITANSNFWGGVTLSVNSTNNTLIDVTANNNRQHGIFLSTSSNNYLQNLIVKDNPGEGISFSSSSGNLVLNSYSILNSTIVLVTSRNNTFLNCSYDFSKESVDSNSQLIRQWYYQANISSNNNPIIANLSAYNSSGAGQFNLTSNIAGLTNKNGIIDYINVNNFRNYYSNYTINTSSGILIEFHKLNVSARANLTGFNGLIFENIALETVFLAPRIIRVENLGNIMPNAGTVKNIKINFTAYDANNFDDLEDSSVRVNVSRAGYEQSRQSLSCVRTSSWNVYYANYSCSVGMQYFDKGGNWNITVSIEDKSHLKGVNDSTSFNYTYMTSLDNTLLLDWGVLALGDINNKPLNPFIINNTGNVDISAVKINATNLFNQTYFIGVGNFSVNSSDGNGTGQLLINNAFVNVSNSSLPSRSSTFIGERNLYFYIKQIPVVPYGDYQTINPWDITFYLLVAISIRKRKKNKKIKIFLSIFRLKLSPAEALCKYLRENKQLSVSDIAKIINRDKSTVSINYKNAVKKIKERIKDEGDLFVDTNIFSNRKLSVLESVVSDLRERGYKNVEVAKMLEKDQRNTSTLYLRAQRKILEKTKNKKQLLIPVTIFRKKRSPAGALFRYLRENERLKFSEIAELTNRSESTIWTEYNNSINKSSKEIKIESTEIYIKLSIFSNRKLSVLESLVSFLKKKGYRNIEIAGMLEKDQRNISTLYSRVKRKIR